jgi:hypothetical protein
MGIIRENMAAIPNLLSEPRLTLIAVSVAALQKSSIFKRSAGITVVFSGTLLAYYS